MKAVVFDRIGDPDDVLAMRDLPDTPSQMHPKTGIE